jgi:Collagen triple helix repeat (20 copies)
MSDLAPDRTLRAVAEVMIEEEKAREAADKAIAADLLRIRERIDEYGNVIETKFLGLEHRMREQIASHISSLNLKNGDRGEKGDAGEQGNRGEPGEKGDQGEPGPAGPAGYVGRALGRFNAEMKYRAMDVVACNGSEWRAITDDPGPLPGDGWMLSAKVGAKGDRGAPGERGERGPAGPPGPQGVGIIDVVIDNGVLVIMLSNGQQKEFMLEAAA